MIDLTGYVPLISPVKGMLTYDMERADARTVHNDTMKRLGERLEQLALICGLNGHSNDPHGWTELIDRIERDPDSPGDWTPRWSAIGFDIALALGQNLVDRSGGALEWKLYTGSKRSLSYHHTVITGFQNIPNKSYFLDPWHVFQAMMRRRLRGEQDDGIGAYLDYIAIKI